jgi:signal transduction histidine kinase
LAVPASTRTGGGDLRIIVAGNGRGPVKESGDGFGIIGMIERARSVGGVVEAGPGQGGGFVVAAVLPLNAGQRAEVR